MAEVEKIEKILFCVYKYFKIFANSPQQKFLILHILGMFKCIQEFVLFVTESQHTLIYMETDLANPKCHTSYSYYL